MHVIDSHTGGEPTRVILDGGPDLGDGPIAERAQLLARDHRRFYRSITLEPRGQVAMVCALLTKPVDPNCVTGVIYFDAEAVLGMCGHGTIGLAATLFHMGKIGLGRHRFETPVGIVSVDMLDANTVTVTNIESHRLRTNVPLDIDGLGTVTGDIAYGGNYFFIVDPSPIPVVPSNIRQLTEIAVAVRGALTAQRLDDDREAKLKQQVDHVIFYGPAILPGGHSRNFVLCPDDAYDRSPCGTGSSARLACLAADGLLGEGEDIIQESIIGSSYQLSYRYGPNGGIIPSIMGRAYVIAESKLFFLAADPFKDGIEL